MSRFVPFPQLCCLKATEIIVVCSGEATVPAGERPAQHQTEDGEQHHGQSQPPAQHDL